MAKAIMVQGTMSNAGKSLVAAGLCRIFWQDGYRVAPFKAQNMALNSYITDEGLEMGRAQAVQAEAGNLSPSVRMNPILLKPVSAVGSQLIVNGEVRGNVSAQDYLAMKRTLLPTVRQAYESLAAESDIMVLEGAGSPAEINLRSDDLVNMGMARLARSPVLLVGDIDRGGVFAQLYGTIALLEAEEQSLVKALVINKFRGDPAILQPGLALLEQRTGKPVAGVIPLLPVDIADEDSLAQRLERRSVNGLLDIVVIRLPHIANFTDFAALEASPGVGLRYIRKAAELGRPDMLVLPGSKSTISDLKWLRESGLEAAIKQLAATGTVIAGLCGGYQMLGQRIIDAAGVEGGGAIAGLGLLPAETEFSGEKQRSRVTAQALSIEGALSRLSNAALEGYEIHMGRTWLLPGAKPLLRLDNGVTDGCQQGNVYGSYLHGFFDTAPCRQAVLDALCQRKGISLEQEAFDLKAYTEQQYDLLADGLRQSLDMALIYRILQEGI